MTRNIREMNKKQTDGQADGQTDGQTDGRTDRADKQARQSRLHLVGSKRQHVHRDPFA